MVARDFEMALERLVPEEWGWQHIEEGEENAPSHPRASLMGPQVLVPFRDGELALGTLAGDLLLRVRRAAHALGLRQRPPVGGRRRARRCRRLRPFVPRPPEERHMRLKAIWILCALALGALALVATGCGGGGETTTVTVTVDVLATRRTPRPRRRRRTDDAPRTRRRPRDDTDTETEATDTDDDDARPARSSRSRELPGVRPARERLSPGAVGHGRHGHPGGGRRDAEVRRRGAGGHPATTSRRWPTRTRRSPTRSTAST